METSLHRQLKALYAVGNAQIESPLGPYRIDVRTDDELIEIQHGSLAALRDKVRTLLGEHRVRIVKPLVVRRTLVKLDQRENRIVERRLSPKRGKALDLFDELVYFVKLFPHERLTLDVLLVEIEELRSTTTMQRPRRRRRRPKPLSLDQKLITIVGRHEFRAADDLCDLLPATLPHPFHTGQLAESLDVPRWVAQRVAYCLKHCGAVRAVGKSRNAMLYEFSAVERHSAAA